MVSRLAVSLKAALDQSLCGIAVPSHRTQRMRSALWVVGRQSCRSGLFFAGTWLLLISS